jgi:hypothetical protein
MDPTVEAALISAIASAVGIVGTVVVAISAARNTRKATERTIQAERLSRIDERRVEAYHSALADLIGRHSERRAQFLDIRWDDDGNLFKSEVQPYEAQDWYRTHAGLLAYASQAVRAAFERAEAADQDLATLARSRSDLVQRALDLDREDLANQIVRTQLSAALRDLESRKRITLEQARKIDREFLEAIRSELALPRQLGSQGRQRAGKQTHSSVPRRLRASGHGGA